MSGGSAFNVTVDPLVAAVLVGIAVALAGAAAIVWSTRRVEQQRRAATVALIRDYSAPGGVTATPSNWRGQFTILPRLGHALVTGVGRRRIARNLAYAGYASDRALARMESAKAVGLIVGASLGLMVASLWGGWWLAGIIGLPVLGYFLPDIWLRSRAQERAERIGQEMPEAMDLLYLCVNAGQGLTAAMNEVAKSQSGPLAAEFARLIKEMQLGMSRQDAFRELRKRTQQPDLQKFADAMIQTDRSGVPMSAVMAEQARAMRERRRTKAREQAQQVGVKILFPLVLCFLPGIFVVAVGPAVIQLVTSFMGN